MIRIGEKIKEVYEASGMSMKNFAERLNRTPANCRNIFLRNSVDTDLLISIGKILDYDFMGYIDSQVNPTNVNEPLLPYGKDEPISDYKAMQFIKQMMRELDTFNKKWKETQPNA